MYHRKGIDLVAPIKPSKHHEYVANTSVHETVSGMRDWEVLGAKCGKCGHTAWLDPKKVTRHAGNHYLMNVGRRLVCRCGNREGNTVLVGTLGRD